MQYLFFKKINCIIEVIEIVMVTNHNLEDKQDLKANLYKYKKGKSWVEPRIRLAPTKNV